MWAIAIIAIILIFLISRRTNAQKKADHTPTSNPISQAEQKYELYDRGEDIIRNAPYPSPVFGFANMPEFEVRGKKKTTNRMNTRKIRCANENAAKAYAIQIEGLMEPLCISVAPLTPPPRLDSGLSVPDGASFWDAIIFEGCVLSNDTKHTPPKFMAYLTERGIPMTWLAGRNRAADAAFKELDLQEKSALYGYAVHCSMQGRVPGNIKNELNKGLYTEFAEAASHDIPAYNSIAKRPGSDMWAPSKETKAYQFAVSFFSTHPRSVSSRIEDAQSRVPPARSSTKGDSGPIRDKGTPSSRPPDHDIGRS